MQRKPGLSVPLSAVQTGALHQAAAGLRLPFPEALLAPSGLRLALSSQRPCWPGRSGSAWKGPVH